jgi:hypothetical protein
VRYPDSKNRLACAYGVHSWLYDQPTVGLKQCQGPCKGVYSMTPGEGKTTEPEPTTEPTNHELARQIEELRCELLKLTPPPEESTVDVRREWSQSETRVLRERIRILEARNRLQREWIEELEALRYFPHAPEGEVRPAAKWVCGVPRTFATRPEEEGMPTFRPCTSKNPHRGMSCGWRPLVTD